MRYSRGWKKTKMMGNHLYTLLAGAPEVLRKRVLVDEWILILSVKKFWNNISFIFLKTDFSEKIFYFKNAFLQQKSSEILRMFKIRIMTQTVIEMQFLPSQHSNAEEISSRMQKGSILKKCIGNIVHQQAMFTLVSRCHQISGILKCDVNT